MFEEVPGRRPLSTALPTSRRKEATRSAQEAGAPRGRHCGSTSVTMIEVEAWQVAGTVGAIVFGTVGATVAITKLNWDRRDRRSAKERDAAEAERIAHERERLRREQADWQAADEAQEEARRLRIYSEAQAREFMSQPREEYPAVRMSPRPGKGGGMPIFVRVGLGVVFLVCVAAGLLWVLLH